MIVYLDTNCVIYFVERKPTWWPKVTARITQFRAAKDELSVGDLTRAECFVVPFKTADTALETRYRTFFSDPDIRGLPLTAVICERAARIRAVYPFKLPDALHLERFPVARSTGGPPVRFPQEAQAGRLCYERLGTALAIAIEHGCGLFLTADSKLARCTDITVEVLK